MIQIKKVASPEKRCNLNREYINHNLKPIAYYNIKNMASKKTLEKSGFISNHRIIHVSFN